MSSSLEDKVAEVELQLRKDIENVLKQHLIVDESVVPPLLDDLVTASMYNIDPLLVFIDELRQIIQNI